MIGGKEFRNNSIHHAMKNRIAFLPANRKENSVVPDMSILENMYISEHTLSSDKPIIKQDLELGKYGVQKENLNIKAATPHNLVVSLSGGNQQKVFFARWLNTEAEILLLDNPTQGIDVGAKAEIYKLILKLAEEGKTVVVITHNQAITRMADRIITVKSGKIQSVELNSEKLPVEEISW